jgi:Glycosyltransferase family 87
MSSTDVATLAADSVRVRVSPVPAVSARERPSAVEVALVGSCFAIVAMVLSFAMGRDLNWDYFNYHGYAAFDVFGHRLRQDFLPAGMQGYLNRLAYLPFALMDAAGWHSAAIGAVLAAFQSLNALFLYLIARELTLQLPRPRVVAATIAVLGAASSVFLLQLGSSFVDPMTTPPVMAAVWMLMRRGDLRTLFLAGSLCGLAVALKLTNVPFAVGLMVAALVAGPGRTAVAQSLAAAGAGVIVGFLLLCGYWGWMLAELHASPVFPLFNNIFRSPDFPAQAVTYHRFVPQTMVDALRLPFFMIEHRSYIYVEGVAPDLRPALLVVLTLLAAALASLRRWRGVIVGAHAGRPSWDARARRGMLTFFAVSTFAWLLTSGNGRYATPLLLLLAPLIFTTAAAALGPRQASMLCLAVLPLQLLLLVDAGNPRWAPHDWAPRWMPAEVPQALQSAPALYVSTSTSSESYVAAHVHPDSVFVNPIGLSSIPNDGPGWDRFVALRDRFVGRTKVLFALPAKSEPEVKAKRIATMNAAVDRLGLAIDPAACAVLTFNRPSEASLRYLWARRDDVAQERREIAACDASPVRPSADLAQRRAAAAAILDAFERKCPAIFSPNGMQLEGTGNVWSRLYGKFDLVFFVDFQAGDIVYRQERQATDVIIGNVRTWSQDLERFRCRLPHSGARDISTMGGDAGR